MPKATKSRPKKKKIKPKDKAKPEPPGFTTKKSYWITLTAMFTVVSAVFGWVQRFDLPQTSLLVVTVAVVIGTVGFIRVSPSTLPFSKRATFVFVGASVIGFGIWAAFALVVVPQIGALVDEFVILTSLTICLAVGALIGELIGRNRKVQERLFPFQNI